jgi:hypothetical protein
MLLLSSICEALGDKLGPLFPQIKALLAAGLADRESVPVSNGSAGVVTLTGCMERRLCGW